LSQTGYKLDIFGQVQWRRSAPDGNPNHLNTKIAVDAGMCRLMTPVVTLYWVFAPAHPAGNGGCRNEISVRGRKSREYIPLTGYDRIEFHSSLPSSVPAYFQGNV